METLDIFGWCYIALLYTLSITCVIWLFIFYKHRHYDFVSCRQQGATLLCNSLIIAFLSIERPLVTLWSQLEWYRPNYHRVITQCCWFLFGVGAIYCLLYRTYVIWFEINRQIALQDRDWRRLINSRDVNWFLDPINKRRYGNYRRIALFLCVMVICSAIPTSIIWGLYPEDSSMENPTRIADSALTLLPIIGLFGLYRKTPILNDAFYIQKELQSILRTGCGFAFLQFVLTMTLRPESHKGTWKYLVFMLNTTVCLTFIVWTSTMRVIHKCRKYKISKYAHGQSTMHKVDTLVGASVSSSEVNIITNQKNKSSQDQVEMRDLLQDSAGFEAFMRHLTKEWSGENLLFLTETIQFQQELQRMLSAAPKLDCQTKLQILAIIDDESSENREVFDSTLRLPTSVPESDIVFSDLSCDDREMGEVDFHHKAIKLYQKYIGNQAPFQVNVSFKMEERLKKKLFESGEERVQNIALINVFGPIQEEIWLMMNGSFQRFKKTMNFMKLSKRLMATKMRQRRHSSMVRQDTLSLNTYGLTDSITKAIKKTMVVASLGKKLQGRSLKRQSSGTGIDRSNAVTIHDAIDSRCPTATFSLSGWEVQPANNNFPLQSS